MSIIGNIGTATRKGFRNLMRAREHEAVLSVHAYLATLDDDTLSRAGYKRSQLKRGGSVNHLI